MDRRSSNLIRIIACRYELKRSSKNHTYRATKENDTGDNVCHNIQAERTSAGVEAADAVNLSCE
jgi:hypothetical protein